jgi:hypothetical protein
MSSSSTYILLAFLVVPIYIAIQRHLRYLRLRRAIAKYGFRDRTSLRAMTMDQAGEIQRYLFELEFPDAFDRSLTYGFTQVCAVALCPRLCGYSFAYCALSRVARSR